MYLFPCIHYMHCLIDPEDECCVYICTQLGLRHNVMLTSIIIATQCLCEHAKCIQPMHHQVLLVSCLYYFLLRLLFKYIYACGLVLSVSIHTQNSIQYSYVHIIYRIVWIIIIVLVCKWNLDLWAYIYNIMYNGGPKSHYELGLQHVDSISIPPHSSQSAIPHLPWPRPKHFTHLSTTHSAIFTHYQSWLNFMQVLPISPSHHSSWWQRPPRSIRLDLCACYVLSIYLSWFHYVMITP